MIKSNAHYEQHFLIFFHQKYEIEKILKGSKNVKEKKKNTYMAMRNVGTSIPLSDWQIRLHHTRDVKLSPCRYFNQRLLNYTQKFASDPDYIF